jgi:glycosyltransferase involved in cell wall biosynthesis
MKIGIVSNTSFNIFNYRLGLILALQKSGHEVVAIAPVDNFTEKIISNGIKFSPIKQLTRKGTNPFGDLLLVYEFYHLYKSNKLDIVLQYTIKPNIFGTIGAKLASVKSICTVTGLGYVFLNNGLSSKIAKVLYAFAFKSAYLVVFQNKDDAQTFKEQKLLLKQNFDVFPGSGLDTNYYSPDFCNAKKSSGIKILMVSRLLIDKGILEYIEVAKNLKAKYPNVQFQILGEMDKDNPAAISETQLSEWLKEEVFEYFPFSEDIRTNVCNADAIVLPSYREGLPRVILEGMAMEKICITTDAPGCVDTIEDGISGFIAKVKDAKSLQQKVEEFLNLGKDKRREIELNARQRAIDLFDNRIVIQKYFSVLEKIKLKIK